MGRQERQWWQTAKAAEGLTGDIWSPKHREVRTGRRLPHEVAGPVGGRAAPALLRCGGGRDFGSGWSWRDTDGCWGGPRRAGEAPRLRPGPPLNASREARKAAGTSRRPRGSGRYPRRAAGGGGGGSYRRLQATVTPHLRRRQRLTRAGTAAASTPAARTLDCSQSSPSLLGGDYLRPRASRRPAALTRRQKRSPGAESPSLPSLPQRHFAPDWQLRRARRHTEANSLPVTACRCRRHRQPSRSPPRLRLRCCARPRTPKPRLPRRATASLRRRGRGPARAPANQRAETPRPPPPRRPVGRAVPARPLSAATGPARTTGPGAPRGRPRGRDPPPAEGAAPAGRRRRGPVTQPRRWARPGSPRATTASSERPPPM